MLMHSRFIPLWLAVLATLVFGAATIAMPFTLWFAIPFAAAAPIPQRRDVWTPPVTCPDASSVWQVGQTYTVTWFVQPTSRSLNLPRLTTTTGAWIMNPSTSPTRLA